MDEIAVSKFKATCLAALARVRRTGRPLRVTRFGRPLADVVPPQSEPRVDTWVGAMRGNGRITGDVVAPTEAADAWTVTEAPVTTEVAFAARARRSRHRDPVDRFLAATAQVFDLILVTSDQQLLAMKGSACCRIGPARLRDGRRAERARTNRVSIVVVFVLRQDPQLVELRPHVGIEID